MKTKIIICGVLIAAISMFTISKSRAQAQEPAIKIIPTDQADIIRIIYAQPSDSPVHITFKNSAGLVFTENLPAQKFGKGFMKKYDVENMNRQSFWVEVESRDVSATFKLSASNNKKWTAQLEAVTYSFPVLASN